MRKMLRNNQWERIEHLLPGKPSDRGVTAKDTGCSSKQSYGFCAAHGAIYRRRSAIGITCICASRGGARAAFGSVSLTAVGTRADLQSLLLDSTIVRAHQHAVGAPKKEGAQAIGRSRGGLSTKIHMASDALGNPVRWQLTGSEVHDITQAPALIEGLDVEQVIADKGYDSDAFIAVIQAAGAQPVIPSRKNRRAPRAYDRDAYRERHLIECLFNVSSNFDASPLDMKSLRVTSYPCSILPPPTRGSFNC
jgi:transposase